MVANRLRANGYETATALSGARGLEFALRSKPDLILLDSVMPEMPGEEVLYRIRQDGELRGIPVIMLTADVKKTAVSEFRLRGAKEVVFKPFTPEELLQTVRKVLGPAG
jgi:CheY-like chemotaxis protein